MPNTNIVAELSEINTFFQSINQQVSNTVNNFNQITLPAESVKSTADNMLTLSDNLMNVSDGLSQISDLGETAFSNLLASLAESSPEVQSQFDELLTKWDEFKMALEGPLEGPVLTLGEFFTNLLTKITEFAESNPLITQFILTFLGIGTVLAAIAVPLAAFLSAMAGLAGAFSLTLGPMLLIAAGIVALIAVIVLIATHWDTIKAKTIEVWNIIKEFLIEKFNAIKEFVMGVWSGIIDFLSGVWEGVKTAFTAALTFIVDLISLYFETLWTVIQTIWNTILEIFTAVWEGIKMAVSAGIEFVKGIIDSTLKVISTIWNTIWSTIKNVIGTVWDGIKNTVSAGIEWISEFIGKAKETLGNVFRDVWDSIVGIVDGAINKVKDTVLGVVNWITDKINGLLKLIGLADEGAANVGSSSGGSRSRRARGGIVRGHGNGDIVPALLTPGELVLNAAQQRNLADNLMGGGGGNIIININGPVSNEEVAEEIGNIIVGQLQLHTKVV